MTAEELARRLGAVYTGAITDALDAVGYQRQTLPAGIGALERGMRTAGPAFPVEWHPRPGHDYDPSIRRILTMLGAVPAGHVAVYQTNDAESAHLGELSVIALMARGCAGVVIDGGCRDVAFTLREGLPVFCRYTTPQDCVPRMEVVAWGHAIEVGGVRVGLGDIVVADEDGVVVVPARVAKDVLTRAEAKVSAENEVRAAVRAGTAPLEAYERHGTF